MSFRRWLYRHIPLRFHRRLPFPVTRHIPSVHIGGSTYGWTDGGCKDGAERWWHCCHVVKHYDRETALDQLHKLWDAGHRTLRIPVYWTGYEEGKPQPEDGSQVMLTKDHELPYWYMENLKDLVITAQVIGFKRLLLSSHPVGNRETKLEWPVEWHWENTDWIRAALEKCFVDTGALYVDILNESMDAENIGAGHLAATTEMLSSNFPKAKFFAGSRGSPDRFPYVLKRLKQMDEVTGGGVRYAGLNFYGRSKEAGRQVDVLFQQLPNLKGVIVAEAQFNDPTVAQDIRRSLAVYGRKVEFVCQWGLARKGLAKCNAEHNNVDLPLYDRSAWIGEGF